MYYECYDTVFDPKYMYYELYKPVCIWWASHWHSKSIVQIFIDPQMADDAREYLEERIEEKKELEELKSQDPELVQNAKIAEDFLNQAQETTKK